MIDPKAFIIPLQKWLLAQGKCVGCGRSLSEGQKKPSDGIFLVTCRCHRIFVYQQKENTYHRALFKEAE